jgi:hypothetical protein
VSSDAGTEHLPQQVTRPAPDSNANEIDASLGAAGTPGAWTWAALEDGLNRTLAGVLRVLREMKGPDAEAAEEWLCRQLQQIRDEWD